MTQTAKTHHEWYVFITGWTRQSPTRSGNHCLCITTGDFNQTACCFDVSLFLSCCHTVKYPGKHDGIPVPPQKRVSSSNWRSFLRPNSDFIIIKAWWTLNVWSREAQLVWVCSPKKNICVCVFVCLWSLWFGFIHRALLDAFKSNFVAQNQVWAQPAINQRKPTCPRNPSRSSHNHCSLV